MRILRFLYQCLCRLALGGNLVSIRSRMMEAAPETRFEQVAEHYDDLDPVFRAIWGENLHHGLWEDDVSSAEEAGAHLTEFVGLRLGLQAGERLLDVGCGYGRMAADLAKAFQVKATGMTVSRKQWVQAVPGSDVQHGDWLENSIPDAAFDAVIAVESLEHMSDPDRAVAEIARVLRPGGRVALGCWLSCDSLRSWERRWLIEPIRRDGFLDGMRDEHAVRQCLGLAGLELLRSDDLSRQVERTWSDALWRACRLTIGSREMRRLFFSDFRRSARLATTLQRIWIAYVLGALRYVVFAAQQLD